MDRESFLSERQASWQALEDTLRRGPRSGLAPEEVLALGRGYRAAAADLALARRRFPGDPLLGPLERLVLAGRQAVYGGRRRRRVSLVQFAVFDYWRLVLERPRILAVAALAYLLPCVLAAVWAIHDPGAAVGLLPARYAEAGQPHIHSLPGGAGTQAALASSIFTNNIQVTFLVFAGGLIFGIGSLVMLAYNGVLVGALAGLTLGADNFSVFVRYVAPHGVLELACTMVAGAAGLRLGWSLIDAGVLRRGESLRRAARPAVAIIVGTAPWLVLAGLIEGFVTPHALPLGAALVIGFSVGGLYLALLAFCGRPQSRARRLAEM